MTGPIAPAAAFPLAVDHTSELTEREKFFARQERRAARAALELEINAEIEAACQKAQKRREYAKAYAARKKAERAAEAAVQDSPQGSSTAEVSIVPDPAFWSQEPKKREKFAVRCCRCLRAFGTKRRPMKRYYNGEQRPLCTMCMPLGGDPIGLQHDADHVLPNPLKYSKVAQRFRAVWEAA